MKRKPPWLWVAFVALVSLVGFVAWRLLGGTQPVGSLTVRILSPQNNQLIQSGQGIAIVAQAEADHGLQAINLIVDGEQYAQQEAEGQPAFTAVFFWFGESLGNRHLQVVAVDAQGNSSVPDDIHIGVRSALSPGDVDFVYTPSETGTGAGSIEPASPVADGAHVDGSPLLWLDPNEPASSDGHPLLAEPPLEEDLAVLPMVSDAAPLISVFEVNPMRMGNQVALVYLAEANDDLALDRIELSVQNLAGESSNLTTRCFGEPVCRIEGTFPFASPGEWLVGIHAIDTSGQSSGPSILSVSILADPVLPPAIAILQPTRTSISPANRFADGKFAMPINFNLLEPVRPLLGMVNAETACLRAMAEPRPEGHLVSAVFLCEKTSPASFYLSWEVEAFPSSGIGVGETILQREYEDRASLSPLDTFSFLNEQTSCGTWMTYRLLFTWVNPAISREAIPVGTIDLREVPTPACGSQALVQDLTAVAAEQGVEVTWRFNHASGVSDAIEYSLYRSLPGQPGSSTLLSQGSVPQGALANEDLALSFLDAILDCGFQPYRYSLVTDFMTTEDPGWASVNLAQVPCPQGSIGALRIGLEPGYALLDELHGNPLSWPLYRSVVTASTEIPAGFPWPPGDNLVLLLNVRNTGFSNGEFEPLPGNPMQVAITNEIRANGLVFETTALVECSGYHHQWAYSWELIVNGRSFETGPEFQIASPACLPAAANGPALISASGLSGADCGGAAYCVLLEWEAVPDFPENITDPDILLPVDRLGVYRLRPSVEGVVAEVPPQQVWAVSVGTRSYLDSSIVCTTRAGDLIYRYSLIPMAQGLYGGFGATTAYIPSPACGQPYEIVGTIR